MILRILISVALSSFLTSSAMADPSKIAFWDTQRKGANQQNAQHRPEWYVAAQENWDWIMYASCPMHGPPKVGTS